MEKRNIQLKGLLIVFSLLAIGCAEPFQVKDPDKFEGRTYSSSESDAEFFARMNAVNTADDADTDHPLDQVVLYEEQFPINFGQVARALDNGIKKVKEKLWIKNCHHAGTTKDKRPVTKRYRCGELPIGSIISNSRKRLFTVNFSGEKEKKNGIEYSLTAANIPFYLSRYQKRSSALVRNLDVTRARQETVSTSILDDTYFRLIPSEGFLYSEVCTHLPGGTVFADQVSLKGKFKKKAWFLSLKANANIKIDAGELTYKDVKACGLLRIHLNNEGEPKAKVISVEVPKFNELKREGFQSKVKVDAKGLLSFINGITSLVGYDIEEKIEDIVKKEIDKTVTKEIDKVKDGDIKSGKWIEKYVKVKGVEGKVVNNLNDSLKSELAKKGPGKSIDLRNNIESACLLLSERVEIEQELLEEICRFSFNIKVLPFVRSSEDYGKGCYSYFLNPKNRSLQNGEPRWWSTECQIENRVTLTAPKDLARLYSCIADAYRRDPLELEDGACDKELDKITDKISSEELADVITRAKDIKIRKLTPEKEREVTSIAEEIFGDISF